MKTGIKEVEKPTKCVVWDLDNTLWDGVLLEHASVRLRKGVMEIIKELDRRGILHSIASKNDFGQAMEKLRYFGLHDYILYPQINWNPKSLSITTISESLNIGVDSIAFIDDQAYEREEVSFSHPQVLCIDASEIDSLPDLPTMNPRFVTDDSRKRREMYRNEMKRNEWEREFQGPREEFLASLGMVMNIKEAKEEDLERVEELTIRTNQLNSTGITYSYDELHCFLCSSDHLLLVAELEDKFGQYGKIGLALIECDEEAWTIKLLLMSCRVMSRGVGAVLLNEVIRLAKEQGVTLRSEFVQNGKNRMMFITYTFSGFKEVDEAKGRVIMEYGLDHISPFPPWIKVQSRG